MILKFLTMEPWSVSFRPNGLHHTYKGSSRWSCPSCQENPDERRMMMLFNVPKQTWRTTNLCFLDNCRSYNTVNKALFCVISVFLSFSLKETYKNLRKNHTTSFFSMVLKHHQLIIQGFPFPRLQGFSPYLQTPNSRCRSQRNHDPGRCRS